ncbi:nucleoredoxin-like protein 1 [Diorhabda sublineata]|uniref:nucleoredoxin-like protein 1 n=1 Tax=Diorhabda sublineata TaxID=1163346 RepID=UPI0024E06062|nr:nucleoredoxin-like protein 1 [Diorhabda sublineata]
MDILDNQTIRKPDGSIVDCEEYLRNIKIFILFFSASWVANTKNLIVLLKDLYSENLKRKVGMEIIYVSADTSKEGYDSDLMAQGPWSAIPFKSSICDILRYRYDVSYMPMIIVVKRDGSIITRKGKEELENLGINVLVTWTEFVQK